MTAAYRAKLAERQAFQQEQKRKCVGDMQWSGGLRQGSRAAGQRAWGRCAAPGYLRAAPRPPQTLPHILPFACVAPR